MSLFLSDSPLGFLSLTINSFTIIRSLCLLLKGTSLSIYIPFPGCYLYVELLWPSLKSFRWISQFFDVDYGKTPSFMSLSLGE